MSHTPQHNGIFIYIHSHSAIVSEEKIRGPNKKGIGYLPGLFTIHTVRQRLLFMWGKSFNHVVLQHEKVNPNYANWIITVE